MKLLVLMLGEGRLDYDTPFVKERTIGYRFERITVLLIIGALVIFSPVVIGAVGFIRTVHLTISPNMTCIWYKFTTPSCALTFGWLEFGKHSGNRVGLVRSKSSESDARVELF